MRDLDAEFDSSDVIRYVRLPERPLRDVEDGELEAVLATLADELSTPIRITDPEPPPFARGSAVDLRAQAGRLRR